MTRQEARRSLAVRLSNVSDQLVWHGQHFHSDLTEEEHGRIRGMATRVYGLASELFREEL